MRGSLSGRYVLGSDIDASETSTWNYNSSLGYYKGFTPIGNGTTNFTGIFNGLGHTISGLYTRQTGYYAGMFGCSGATAVFSSVGLINHTVISTVEYVGGLVAYLTDSLVEDSYMLGSVTGRFSVGGLIGQANGGTIVGSYTAGDVNANNYGSGGLVGNAYGASITSSWSSADVTSTSIYVGGLAGYSNGSVTDSYAVGDVVGSTHVGGLIGYTGTATIADSYASGDVTGSLYTGGLVGYNYGAVTNTYALGTVSGGHSTGGLVGITGDTSSISNSNATGDVIGGSNAGGLVGYDRGSVTTSYATGKVSGIAAVGGLVGYNYTGTVSYSYATGTVTGTGSDVGGLIGRNDATVSTTYALGSATSTLSYVGGLVGRNYGTIAMSYSIGKTIGSSYAGGLVGYQGGTVTNSYWNETTSGRTGSTSLTTAEMMAESDFSGWDFTSTWAIMEGVSYPYFQWQGTPGLIKGTSDLTATETVRVVVNGTSVEAISIAVDGTFYAILSQGTMDVGDVVLLYEQDGGVNAANAVYVLGSNVATGLSLSSGTLWADSGAGVLSTASFITALGVLTPSDVLYRVSDNDLTITASMTDLYNTSGSGIELVGSIMTSGNLSFYAPVMLAANVTVDAGAGAITFGSTIDGEFDFSIAGGTIAFAETVGGTTPPSTLFVTGDATLSSDITVYENLTFDDTVTLEADSALISHYGTLTLNGLDNGSYSLTGTARTVDLNEGISWNAGTLTLTATYYDININATMNATGTAGLILTFGDNLNLSDGVKVNLATGASLTINDNVYTIINSLGAVGSSTATDLQGMKGGLAGYYALGSDIDASDTATWNYSSTLGYYQGFQPVGGSTSFTGIFNGLGHTVTNLYIRRIADLTGFFGQIGSAGTVSNVGLINANVTGKSGVGALAGRNNGTIYSSYATGAVRGTSSYTGGLVGLLSGSITDSYADVDVTGTQDVGGLVGYQTGGTITNSHATGDVTGSGNFIGGLVGYEYYSTAYITYSYATGNVSGADYVGGLVGYNTSNAYPITYCYALGSVTGGDYIGGLIGLNNYGSSIRYSYAAGKITATGTNVGGLAARSNGSVSYSYWNKTTTGVMTTSGGGPGTTPEQMMAESAFSSWNFSSTWAIAEGVSYPYLRGQGTPTLIKGTSNLTSGEAIEVAVNGTVVGTGATGADGSIYIMLDEGTVDSGDVILLYVNEDGTTMSNAVYIASGNVLTGLSLTSNTLWADSADGLLSNATFVSARGSLNTTDILYTAFGNALTIVAGSTMLDNSSGSGLTIDGSITTSGNLTFETDVTLGADVVFDVSGGILTVNGTINGAYDLAVTAETFSLAGAIGGTTALDTVLLTSANGLELPSIAAANIIARTTNAAADLTIASETVLTATGTGTSVTLSSGRNFINDAGSSAIVAENGRWLIFSTTPDANTYGSLDSGNMAIWNANYGDTIGQTGNRYLFSDQPTVTFTSSDVSKTYGTDATAIVAGAYTIGGLQSGITGAFLSDTEATAFSGTPDATSFGAIATADAGTYILTVGAGTTTGLNGYVLAYSSSGELTVDPATVTVSAVSANKTYGMTDPALLYTVNGLVLNDTATTILSGSLSRGQGQDIGSYVIYQGTLIATTNYTIVFQGNTFTITPTGKAVDTNTLRQLSKGDLDVGEITFIHKDYRLSGEILVPEPNPSPLTNKDIAEIIGLNYVMTDKKED